jgi:hypothetical protein
VDEDDEKSDSSDDYKSKSKKKFNETGAFKKSDTKSKKSHNQSSA